MKTSWVYILLCADGTYYTGVTADLARRVNEHESGVYGGYTSTRLPVKLVYHQEFDDILQAIRAEKQLKGWSRRKKEALIKNDFDLLHNLAECRNSSRSRKLISPLDFARGDDVKPNAKERIQKTHGQRN